MTTETSRILIVDDQENNQLVIEDILRKLKPELRFADSGEAALDTLQEWVPDLILMDQMMPGLSGTETILKIKAQEEFSHIPVIMVTANNELSMLQDSFDVGAVDYLTKPIEKVALLARVHSALRTKKAFDDIKALTLQLTEQKRELSNFTSMVSHDLKSPLAGASSLFDFFLFRLKEDYPEIWDNESFREILSRIPGSLKKMLNFIDTLLEYASAGKTIGNCNITSTDNLLQTVLDSFEHLEKEGVVLFEKQSGFPEIPCDSIKLAQVWQNLISNAIKYRGEQTPVSISLGHHSTEGSTQFWVADNGPGIPETSHHSIFQPFQRLDFEVEGHGIGLATVQKIIAAHQGNIHIDASHTTGAKFVFEIPSSAKAP